MKLTKKERALELYRTNHNMPRKELISLVMRELNTTENSARTHISNASKQLNPVLGLTYKTRNRANPALKKERAKSIIQDYYGKMSRSDLASKLVNELGLKTVSSARTHISRIVRELNLNP